MKCGASKFRNFLLFYAAVTFFMCYIVVSLNNGGYRDVFQEESIREA